MIIPVDRLSSDALRGLVEEFITREGTDYGNLEVNLETKVQQVKQQLDRGEVLIVFDGATESVNLMTRLQHQQWSSTMTYGGD
jgi:uncharacterized protein YheU (UPF0270 family)